MGKGRKEPTIFIGRNISIGLGLLAILVILSMAYSLRKTPTNYAGLLTNEAPFRDDGAFQVGVRTQEISAQTPLDVMVWYPGSATTTNTISYTIPSPK